MERKWYDDGYDKNVVQEKWYVPPKQQMPQEEEIDRLAEKKSKLKVNIIEFIVGLILLIFCWQYLQTHPVEKVSLFSGFEVIVQKVKIWVSADGEALKKKYELERNYKEVISLAVGSKCLNERETEELQIRFDQLQSLNVQDFVDDESIYRSYIGLTYTKVKRECTDQ